MEAFADVLISGFDALKDYIALHVLTCLIPAFLLAGGIVTFVSRETIIGYLGAAARKISSFSIAAGGSFFVAACSCTVIPVSSGIYYGGAGAGNIPDQGFAQPERSVRRRFLKTEERWVVVVIFDRQRWD
jgi:uncharacterized membrane protein YraQ (UPF0718 family)